VTLRALVAGGSEVSAWDDDAKARERAVAAGFAGFMATRRSTLAGVVCGEFVMLAGKWWLG